MGEVQAADNRAPDIGIGMPGQASEPGLGGVQGFADRCKPAAIEDTLSRAQAGFQARHVIIGQDKGRGHVAERDEVAAEFLERCVCVGRLVGGVIVKQQALFVEQRLAQHGPH